MTSTRGTLSSGPADRPGGGPPEFRWLTSGVPGIGGVIKQRPEDFLVEEIPLYQPAGEGEHLYLFVEKKGISTFAMAAILARHFGVPSGSIGYAGLKDAHAVTRQTVSVHVPGRQPEDFPSLRDERLSILWTDLHVNKLRRGHLTGNRFSIKVRAVDPTAVVAANRILSELARRGVPNRFGAQRFGRLGNNHVVGRGLVRGRWRDVIEALVGPHPNPTAAAAESYALYAQGRYADARDRLPLALRTERLLLDALARGADEEQAVGAIPRDAKRFYLAALQSRVFNRVLDARIESRAIGDLVVGDLAWKHDSRAVFPVTHDAFGSPQLRERLDSFEISPSGPIWGPGMTVAAGATAEIESRMLEAEEITFDDLARFSRGRGMRFDGERRPLRVPVSHTEIEGGVDEHGGYVRCAFDLPRGAFATEVMREVMKPTAESERIADDSGDDDDV
ncbi:MAG: tRNA pseudouridine(13) synthase TruD [Phycisphaerae bacterium]|nr:tRNA pseudouridine(13) synthase TruD [Phycisphaerae bacterium]